ncbi:MAG TPA: hypothetical protein PLX89_20690 [Verrucomicrobiota bacterium]|nr:hypothetical protein [Verrucomicrobiota bacterium]
MKRRTFTSAVVGALMGARTVRTGWLLLSVIPLAVSADTGVIRLRENHGSWQITLYTPSEILNARPTELAVLVQDRATGESVLDATVDLSLIPPAGGPEPMADVVCGKTGVRLSWGTTNGLKQSGATRAFRGQVANGLMYGTSVILPAGGTWRLVTTVQRGDEVAQLDCGLPVVPLNSRVDSIVWLLVTPPFLIVLFAFNQWLRRRTR